MTFNHWETRDHSKLFKGMHLRGKLAVDCIYELNDQVTFDVSYRWYQLNGWTINDGIVGPQSFGFAANPSDVLLAYV